MGDCVDGSGLATSVAAIYDGVTRLLVLSAIDNEKERKAARVRNTR